MKKTDFETPAEALFRYQVISQVLSQVAAGIVLSKPKFMVSWAKTAKIRRFLMLTYN